MRKVIYLAATCLFSSFLSSNLPPKRATVKVTLDKSKETTLVFATIPEKGLVVNDQGPWKLEIQSATGIVTKTNEFKRDQWDKSVAGFKVPVTLDAGSKVVSVKYKMIAFVCTSDKSVCYREVVEGVGKPL